MVTKLGEAATELEEVVKKTAGDGDKDGILSKAIKDAVDVAKKTLEVLKGHLEDLKGIGDDKVVGEAASNSQGTKPDETELKKAYNALKGIVDVADKEGVKKPETGNTAVKVGGNGTDNKDGAKILATSGGNPAATDSGKAASILTTVSGKEILAAIVNSQEGDAALSSDADGNTSAMSFAKGGDGTKLAKSEQAKAGAVSGGIALRALVKTGKLASGAAKGQAGGQEEVQAVGTTAVNKLLVAVEEVIKKTVKKVIEKTKEEIDKARETQEAVE